MKSEVAPEYLINNFQIEQLIEIIKDGLKKRSNLTSKEAQLIIKIAGPHLVADILDAISKYRKIFSSENIFSEFVYVDRKIPLQDVLSTVGGEMFLDGLCEDGELGPLPIVSRKRFDIFFFSVGLKDYITDDELEFEYQIRGLKPVSLVALININVNDYVLHEKFPNTTIWRNSEGEYCCAEFNPTGDRPKVALKKHTSLWNTKCGNKNRWFAGVKI